MLFALLLLTLPVELIYRKLLLLLTFGERNHQLLAEPPRRYFAARNLCYCYHYVIACFDYLQKPKDTP